MNIQLRNYRDLDFFCQYETYVENRIIDGKKKKREREKRRRGVEIARSISSLFVSMIPICKPSLQCSIVIMVSFIKHKVSSYYLR